MLRVYMYIRICVYMFIDGGTEKNECEYEILTMHKCVCACARTRTIVYARLFVCLRMCYVFASAIIPTRVQRETFCECCFACSKTSFMCVCLHARACVVCGLTESEREIDRLMKR